MSTRKRHYQRNKAKILAANTAWRRANRAKLAAARKIYEERNREILRRKSAVYYVLNKEIIAAKQKQYRAANVLFGMVRDARRRAAKKKLPFALEAADLQIPPVCPVLGLPLSLGHQKSFPTSPSLDRIIPAKGYVRGNVRVISWRANDLKKDGTLAEFEALVRYLKGAQ